MVDGIELHDDELDDEVGTDGFTVKPAVPRRAARGPHRERTPR
jgi:hypothetical protein